MKPVIIFATQLVVPVEDIYTAMKAYNLPEISRVKVPAKEEVPAQEQTPMSEAIPYQAATEAVMYSEEEYMNLCIEALRKFREDLEIKNSMILIDFIAKEKDKIVREELSTKVVEAISVNISTGSI